MNRSDGGPRDANAVYEDLRDAARDLAAVHAKRIIAGGIEDPEVQAIRAVYARVYAIDLEDLSAQRQLTIELRNRASDGDE